MLGNTQEAAGGGGKQNRHRIDGSHDHAQQDVIKDMPETDKTAAKLTMKKSLAKISTSTNFRGWLRRTVAA